MFASKFLLPVVSVIGLAAAQSTLCSDAKATHTISSQSDATALSSSCTTIAGSVAIASSVTGAVDLGAIEQIQGDLICNNATQLTSFGGGSLSSIKGDMILTSLTIMSTLSFPELASVNSLQWTTLNALQELAFGTPGLTQAGSVTISDTELNDLKGISLSTVGDLNINNNLYLKSINMALANVTGLLTIASNGAGLIVSFPDLTTVNNMTVRNVSGITIDALTKVNSTLGFYGNLLTSISCPNLTSIGGDLAVVANPNLSNVSMPSLTTIGGGFQIANNSALQNITYFGKLKSTGAINLSGNFSECDLPSLGTVQGSFNLQSSGGVNCSPFTADGKNGVIHGSVTCVANSTNVQASGTSTGSSSSSTSTKKSAAMNNAEMPMLMGAFAVIGGILQLL